MWCIISCKFKEKYLVRSGFLSKIEYKITKTKIIIQKYLFLVMPMWYFSFSWTCSQKQLTSFKCKLLLLAVISFTVLKRLECKKWSSIRDLFKERKKQSYIFLGLPRNINTQPLPVKKIGKSISLWSSFSG